MGWMRKLAARFILWVLQDRLRSMLMNERAANEKFVRESETRLNDACRLRHQHEKKCPCWPDG